MPNRKKNKGRRLSRKERDVMQDLAVGAAFALDGASANYEISFVHYCKFMQESDPKGICDWGDDRLLVERRLGRYADRRLAELAEIKAELQAAEEADTRALDALIATKPTSDIGKAYYRAAIERYEQRLTGDAIAARQAINSLEGVNLNA